MGLDPNCSPEVKSLIAFVNRLGIPYKVTSTCRPGSITISGNLSYHSRGSALDLAGLTPSIDSEALGNIFKAFIPYEAHFAEIIYAGPQVSYNIKNGRRVPKYAQSIHHNHVHIAIKPGQNVDNLAPLAAPEVIDPPVPAHEVNERTDMAVGQVVARPQGGYVVLQTRDGGIFAYDGAPFKGSLVGNGSGPAIGLAWTPSGEGYWILQADGAVFSFGDAVYHGGGNSEDLAPHIGGRLPVGIVASGPGYKLIYSDLSNDGSPFDAYGRGV